MYLNFELVKIEGDASDGSLQLAFLVPAIIQRNSQLVNAEPCYQYER
jgi:hypothetical protein